MKATGIVRRIDDLGRIVIPKEIRRSFRIKEGDPLEIFTDAEGEVIFKKYSPIGELSNFASQYAEVLHKNGGLPIAIMDNDHVVAASGISKREILERRVTKNLEELMENRAIHITNDKIPSVSAIEGYDRKANIVYPIIHFQAKRILNLCRLRPHFWGNKWNKVLCILYKKYNLLLYNVLHR